MLKPCPCGAVPDNLEIEGCGKWGWVSGGCCGEWAIEFRLQYADPTGPEAYRAACVAWDDAPRDAALTARVEKAEAENTKLSSDYGVLRSRYDATVIELVDARRERDEARARIAAARDAWGRTPRTLWVELKQFLVQRDEAVVFDAALSDSPALAVVNRVLVCVNCPSVNPKVAYAVIDGEEVELCRECRARLTCRTVVVLGNKGD